MIKFGTNIRHFRTLMKLKPEDLADIIGISVNFLRNIENGKATNVGTDALHALANYFGVNPMHLTNRDLTAQPEIERTLYTIKEVLDPRDQQTIIDLVDSITRRKSGDGKFSKTATRFT